MKVLIRQIPSATTGLQERGDDMATWSDYKSNVRETNPEIGWDLDEVEAVSCIVGP